MSKANYMLAIIVTHLTNTITVTCNWVENVLVTITVTLANCN